MADIFVSYTRADQEIIRRIVALLEAQGWSVWWDTRISGGERWDEVIEREITVARCVVVVWTPRSADREWVREEADHGRKRGVLVPILLDLDEPPFGFGRIQARDFTGWDGVARTATGDQFLADVRLKLGWAAAKQPPAPTHQPATTIDRVDGRIGVPIGIAGTVHGVEIITRGPLGRYAWFKPGAGKVEWFKDIDVGPEMVVVPAGSFAMGSNERDNEKPPHVVTIKTPFAVGRFAVTFAEWDAAGLAHKPGDQGWGRGRRPVINVSWEDAKAYARWLSQTTGKAYRLPSEAEWEYCCRAGTTTKYVFGNGITHELAQFSAQQTDEVGNFPSNAWGLHDAHGNVWEWCEDTWHDNYKGAPQDGSAWRGQNASQGTKRGGSWIDNDPGVLCSTTRDPILRSYRGRIVGFRLARTL